MIVGFETCFDGARFRGEGWLAVEGGTISAIRHDQRAAQADRRVGFLMPGLTDMAGGVFGYEEGFPEAHALAPLQRCVEQYAAGGVTCVVDTVQPTHTVRALARMTSATQIIAGGGVIDGPPISRPTARVALCEEDVVDEVEAAASDGARVAAAGRYLPSDLLPALIGAARQRGLLPIVGWGTEPRPSIADGVYAGLLPIATGMASWSDLPALLEDPRTERSLRAWVQQAGEDGATVVPLASLFARRLALSEVVSDPGWQECTGFLPYTAHLARMRGPVGLAVGRKMLLERVWIGPAHSDATGTMAPLVGRLLSTLVEHGGRLALGSGFPDFGVFPGTALRAEASMLARGGMSWETILAAATALPGALLHDGQCGSLAPGAAARLVARPRALPRPGWPDGIELILISDREPGPARTDDATMEERRR